MSAIVGQLIVNCGTQAINKGFSLDGAIRKNSAGVNTDTIQQEAHAQADMELKLNSIGIWRTATKHYQQYDIAMFPDSDEVQAHVLILAEITEAAHIMEICQRHRLNCQDTRQTFAKLALKTRQGAVVRLAGEYAIEAVKTLIWEYSLVVEYRYLNKLLLSEPDEMQKWNGYGFLASDPVRWFERAAGK